MKRTLTIAAALAVVAAPALAHPGHGAGGLAHNVLLPGHLLAIAAAGLWAALAVRWLVRFAARRSHSRAPG